MKRHGVTLIEVLTAVAIFSIAILVLFGTFTLALRVTQYAKETTIAANAASQTLELLRANGFDNVAVNASPTAQPVSSLPNGFQKMYVELYNNNDKIKKVTIVIYWNNRPEASGVTITTLIGQGGING